MKAHQNNPQQGEDQVSDQVKFNIFQSIMDSLFQSFSNSVSVSSFQELSACVFSWIEEHCKPQVRSMFKKPMRTLLFCVYVEVFIVCFLLMFFPRRCGSLLLECCGSSTVSFTDCTWPLVNSQKWTF